MFNSEKSRNYISSVIKKSELKKDDFFGSTVSRFYST